MVLHRSRWLAVFLILALLVSMFPQMALAELVDPDPKLDADTLAATFTVSVSPTSGPNDTKVEVSSVNAPSNSPINIVLGSTTGTNGQVVATATTDAQGRFKSSFTAGGLSELKPGNQYGVWAVARPGSTNRASSNIVIFSVSFNLSISPTSGPAKTQVTVYGTQAPANSRVTVFAGDTKGNSGSAVAVVRSDGRGSFNTTFKIGDVGNLTPGDVGIFARAEVSGAPYVPSKVVVFRLQRNVARPTFTGLSPIPFNTIAPGTYNLGAVAQSDSNITKVNMYLNGQALVPNSFQPATKVSINAARYLDAGAYTLTLQAIDQEGDQMTAQWDFTVGGQGESQWFKPGAVAKTENFNATMRSLVEAFRYHLYGQSWDGTRHPELPTHIPTITNAARLNEWARADGTLDRAYTEATLRSLVEVFRWHLFGISWENGQNPGVVTHATTFRGPEPIDPWFDSAGNPNRANIEATMRSLVQAMRWHFWGYSWDGTRHPDIPTHLGQ